MSKKSQKERNLVAFPAVYLMEQCEGAIAKLLFTTFPWLCLPLLTPLCTFLVIFFCVFCGCQLLYITNQRNAKDWFYQRQLRNCIWLIGSNDDDWYYLSILQNSDIISCFLATLLRTSEPWSCPVGFVVIRAGLAKNTKERKVRFSKSVSSIMYLVSL